MTPKIQMCEYFEMSAAELERVEAFIEKELEADYNRADDDASDIGCDVVVEPFGITLQTMDSEDIVTVAMFMQRMVDTCKLDKPMVMYWAYTCICLVPGTFGGGAVIVRRGQELEYVILRDVVESRFKEKA